MEGQQLLVAKESKEVLHFELGQQFSHVDRLKLESTGHLNPQWLEWFMGWPLGWTGLDPLAMDRYQEWRQQHG